MQVIAQQDEWRGRETEPGAEAMAGWELADEIDMLGSPESGYSTLNQIRAMLPADGRLRYNNYGKGVTFWLSDQQAARYVNEFQDVLSADNYWFTDENICAGTEGGQIVAGGADLSPADCHRAANYGATVRRVRGLVSPAGSKPVWAFVELGHPFSEAHYPTIKPAQVRAAVWQSLIAGARGIIYFNHSFGGPDQTQHILRDGLDAGSPYSPIRSAVRATNRQIQRARPSAQRSDGQLRLVQGARDDRDGEVGDKRRRAPRRVQVQEGEEGEMQEGEEQEGRQETVQVQGDREEQMQEGEGALLRVRRLGRIVGAGEVLPAVRR